MAPDLLIAGASTRAAAFSAARAGLRIAAADLFADRDLGAVAEATAITNWPADLETWAARFPPSVPLVYVGGLENEPELLERLAERRPPLGVRGTALREVRTPESLRSRLAGFGLPFPETAETAPPASDRRWLVKPRRSAAGRGIRFWNGEDRLGSGEYLQEFLDGACGSAAYLLTANGAELLGVTEAILPDRPTADVTPFAYTGNVTADIPRGEGLIGLGRMLAATGIVGLAGVDFVRTAAGLVPIEVNPRYTAGMELLELRTGRCLIAEHAAAFGHPIADRPAPRRPAEAASHFGKRIIYAPQTLRAPAIPWAGRESFLAGRYEYADIPVPGTIVPAFSPVCTAFAAAGTAAACRRLLTRREAELLARCEPV